MTHHIIKIGKELGTNFLVGKVKFDKDEVKALKKCFDVLINKNKPENVPGKVEDTDLVKFKRFTKNKDITKPDETVKIDYNFCCDVVNAINETILEAENKGLDGIEELKAKMKEYQKLKFQLKK